MVCKVSIVPDIFFFIDLGSDLRWYGHTGDYHNLYLHQDDVDEFVRRVKDHRS